MKKLKSLVSHVRAASEFRSVPLQFSDILLHKLVINLAPSDYYRFEFYRNDMGWQEKSRYVAFDGSVYWPFENNEFKYASTLTNKYIQKHLLIGFGIPTPRLITTLGDDMELHSKEQFIDFLDKMDRHVVIKPVNGAGGTDVRIVTKIEGGVQSGNKTYTQTGLWDQLMASSCKRFLIEDRVSNMGVLARLNPNCLNTFRAVTIKTNDGRWHCAAISVKIGADGAMVDNNADGGIQINLDTNGKPVNAYDFAAKASITHHKRTGIELMGLEFEGYRDVLELALSASQKFNFLGTIGWDIAFTEGGPMIIEGNIVWGCSSLQRGRPGIITDELARGLTKHRVFGRWDKSCLYPGYDKKPLWRRRW